MQKSRLSNNFGGSVKKRRLAAGMTQEALAEAAKLHPTYVSMVERGKRNPTLESAYAIAKALGVKLAELIKEAEELP